VVLGLVRMMVATTRMRERERAPGEGGLFSWKVCLFHVSTVHRPLMASERGSFCFSIFFPPPALLFWLEGTRSVCF
jgi:hypothetical protein